MKRNHLYGIALVAVFLGIAPAAGAQSRQVIRGDAAGTIGWLAANTQSPSSYDRDDWASSLFGSGSVGWHWSDNLKTEFDFGAGTEADAYETRQITVGTRTTYVSTRSHFARRTLGLSQQYQFFHNSWFHPHVAAGVNLTWERRTDDILPIYFYDDIARTSRLLEGQRTEGPDTSFTVRPFVALGYKAYMTERMFFRNDLRIAFRGGIDETTLRLGFGFDF